MRKQHMRNSLIMESKSLLLYKFRIRNFKDQYFRIYIRVWRSMSNCKIFLIWRESKCGDWSIRVINYELLFLIQRFKNDFCSGWKYNPAFFLVPDDVLWRVFSIVAYDERRLKTCVMRMLLLVTVILLRRWNVVEIGQVFVFAFSEDMGAIGGNIREVMLLGVLQLELNGVWLDRNDVVNVLNLFILLLFVCSFALLITFHHFWHFL